MNHVEALMHLFSKSKVLGILVVTAFIILGVFIVLAVLSIIFILPSWVTLIFVAFVSVLGSICTLSWFIQKYDL